MTDLHAIFRQTGDGRWQSYSRPESIYVVGADLDAARREFREAAEFHFDEQWPDVSVYEHMETSGAQGIYIRTALDDKLASRQSTARIIRKSLDVPASMAITRARALESSTGDVVFVCCEPDDRVKWVSTQLGRVDAVQVCAPIAGDRGIWWMPLAAPAKGVPASESETLAAAGLDGDDATVAQLTVWAERYAEQEARRTQEALGLTDGTPFEVSTPPLVAA